MWWLLRIPRTVQNIQRFRQIVAVLVEYGFEEIVVRTGLAERWWTRWWLRLWRRSHPEPPGSPAERFVAMLERLGPTFVKFGQILSTRPDLLPESWIAELARLQEEVAPVPVERLRPAIAAAVGDFDAVFAAFEPEPLASASVGQVHAARLHDGTEVVVKVIRPGIRELVARDVAIMRVFAELIEQRIPELRAFRPTGVVDEFEQAILHELDLRREARNAERFRHNFAEVDYVVVPRVWHQYSSRDVLVMERIEGVKLTDYAAVGNDPKVLARRGIRLIFKMCFEDRFFHADPHPGNIWTLPGNRLALLDLGMADFVLAETRDILVDLLFAVAADEPEKLPDAVRRLGEAPEALDEQRFRRDLLRLYEDYVRGIRMADLNLGELINASITVARRHHIVIPTDITLLLKALATVEGVGKQLDPELDLLSEARPLVAKLVNLRWGPERIARDLVTAAGDGYELLTSLPRRLDGLLTQAEQGRLRVRAELPDLDRHAGRVEAAANRVAVALLVVAMAIAGQTLWQEPWLSYRDVPIGAMLLLGVAAFFGTSLLVAIWRGRNGG